MYNRRRSVLIAESDRAIAQLLRLHLERAGFSVFVAYDGEQAAILAARQRFELIVTSLNLPVMDGAQFCQHVREELQLTEVPIVVCPEANFEEEAEELQFLYGVTHVVSRPIDPSAIVKIAESAVDYLVTFA